MTVALTIACSISALSTLALVGLVIYSIWQLRLRTRDLRDQVSAWFAVKDEKTPSDFALLVNQIALIFGQTAGQSVIAGLRGAVGGTTKELNAEQQLSLEHQNPALGLVGAFSPNLSRKLGKNPLVLAGLQAILGNIIGKAGNSSKNDARGVSLGNPFEFGSK